MFAKIAKKMNAKEFALLKEQAGSTGVHIIKVPLSDQVTSNDVVGKIGKTVFNTGKRIEVDVGGLCTKTFAYSIEKISGVFYVGQKAL